MTYRTARVRFGLIILFACLTSQLGLPQTFSLLHTFEGTDGASPASPLLRDSVGNLYGAAALGGDLNCNAPYGCGMVFILDPTGNEAVLHVFSDFSNGLRPLGALVRDDSGNLYGTTIEGGDAGCQAGAGCGVVFKLDSSGNETVLHTFTGGADGNTPNGLMRDAKGNFYGTTQEGGDLSCNAPNGCGVVFELDSAGNEIVLYAFKGGADGLYPVGGVIRDFAGNLYGTTYEGGAHRHGTVFKVSATGVNTILYSFGLTKQSGFWPVAGLVGDAQGNLYGSTPYGNAYGSGFVFRLNTRTGQEAAIYSFGALGELDAAVPRATLIRDAQGNLYGTTLIGGANAGGTAFVVTGDGSETVLHEFGGTDGINPETALLRDSSGNLYGSAPAGGDLGCNPPYGCGVVFEISFP